MKRNRALCLVAAVSLAELAAQTGYETRRFVSPLYAQTERRPVDDTMFAEIADQYQVDSNLPIAAETEGVWPHHIPYVIESISYGSTNQQRVPAFFTHPKDSTDTKYPAVLLLHGSNDFWGKSENWTRDWIDILSDQVGVCSLLICLSMENGIKESKSGGQDLTL